MKYDSQYFYCPITQARMVDPVIAPDGITYERAAIAERLGSESKVSNPGDDTLYPNLALKEFMEKCSKDGLLSEADLKPLGVMTKTDIDAMSDNLVVSPDGVLYDYEFLCVWTLSAQNSGREPTYPNNRQYIHWDEVRADRTVALLVKELESRHVIEMSEDASISMSDITERYAPHFTALHDPEFAAASESGSEVESDVEPDIEAPSAPAFNSLEASGAPAMPRPSVNHVYVGDTMPVNRSSLSMYHQLLLAAFGASCAPYVSSGCAVAAAQVCATNPVGCLALSMAASAAVAVTDEGGCSCD